MRVAERTCGSAAVLIVLTSLALYSATMFAQGSYQAQVRGTVTDPTGAAGLVHGAIDGLRTVATSLASFVNSL